MVSHPVDRARREGNVSLHGEDALCRRCGGTGNELLLMYRACSDCGGMGVKR